MRNVFFAAVFLICAGRWYPAVCEASDNIAFLAQSTVTRPAAGIKRHSIDPNKAKIMRQKPRPTGNIDLTVQRIDIVPPYPRVGGECKYRVWLKKYPNLNPKPVGVLLQENLHNPGFNQKQRTFWIPQVWHPDQPAFVFDCRASHHIDSNLLQGRYRVTVTLDTKGDITESIEHNNRFSTEYSLYRSDRRMADLVFEERNHYFESDSPSNQLGVNQDVKIWGYIKNQGDDTARPFTVVMECEIDREGPAWSNTFKQQIRVGRQIKPNEVHRFQSSARWAVSGLKVCRFRLDTADEVIESNEYNNAAQKVLSVRIH